MSKGIIVIFDVALPAYTAFAQLHNFSMEGLALGAVDMW